MDPAGVFVSSIFTEHSHPRKDLEKGSMTSSNATRGIKFPHASLVGLTAGSLWRKQSETASQQVMRRCRDRQTGRIRGRRASPKAGVAGNRSTFQTRAAEGGVDRLMLHPGRMVALGVGHERGVRGLHVD